MTTPKLPTREDGEIDVDRLVASVCTVPPNPSNPHPDGISSWNQLIKAIIAQTKAQERERCARVAEEWLNQFGHINPQAVSTQKWTNDAVKDIADAIRGMEP